MQYEIFKINTLLSITFLTRHAVLLNGHFSNYNFMHFFVKMGAQKSS